MMEKSDEIILIGTMEGFGMANRIYSPKGICQTIRTFQGGWLEPKILESDMNEIITYRIRKLTSRECWRLMGFADADYEKAAGINSKAQLYKQAGNSIVVPVLMAIFSQLNIDGVKPWNERTEDEIYDLIDTTTRDYAKNVAKSQQNGENNG